MNKGISKMLSFEISLRKLFSFSLTKKQVLQMAHLNRALNTATFQISLTFYFGTRPILKQKQKRKTYEAPAE